VIRLDFGRPAEGFDLSIPIGLREIIFDNVILPIKKIDIPELCYPIQESAHRGIIRRETQQGDGVLTS